MHIYAKEVKKLIKKEKKETNINCRKLNLLQILNDFNYFL